MRARHIPKSIGGLTEPLPLEEKEYRLGLYRLEMRAIIPLKWIVLAVTLGLCIWVIETPLWIQGPLPSHAVFWLFFCYFVFNCFDTVVFYFFKVSMNAIRPLTLISYLVDLLFVGLLIYFDLATRYFGQETHHDFYLLYFLLAIRGIGLFKTVGETLFVNLLISLLYILAFYLEQRDPAFFLETRFAVSLIVVWMVVLLSWFIVMIITRQKIELLEAHDYLLRAENLGRVGELAAGVAHEINNPIGIIAATAEYLKRCTPPEDKRHEDIDAIYNEAMRCKDIVQELLTYANPRPVGTTPIELSALNDEVLHFVFPKHKSSQIRIVREYEQDAPYVKADPNLLKQALLNLYINAQQAIPKNKDGMIISRVRSQQRGRTLHIEVQDNGMGIPESNAKHIFEPFYTRKTKGTGLGLAITQRIVEMFDGRISVRPAEGGGSIFTIVFPAARG